MKKKIERFFSAIAEFFEMIFFSAAENQILIMHKGKEQKKSYVSYTQLKKHQKRIRRFAMLVLLGAIFFFVGTVIGPALFPKVAKTEVFIPNGKGDIMIGNVSKNQATVIFKTLDAENEYKPLATKAYVEVCEDQSCKKVIKKTDEDDYAVTHIVPISSLKEGQEYYFRITASDSSVFANPKVVSSWGDGYDPIKVLTTGEMAVSSCVGQNNFSVVSDVSKNSIDIEKNADISPVPTENVDDSVSSKNNNQSLELAISNVQNESYLQPRNKVQTIISWGTNVPASTVLVYSEGAKGEEKELVVSGQKVTKHAAILTTFKAGTAYYFKAKSEDGKGNVVVSEEYSLHTPNPKETVMQAIADNFQALLYQIKPN